MRYLLILLVFLLAGCLPETSDEKQARLKRRADNKLAAEAFLKQSPLVQSHSIGGNQIMLVDVPTKNDVGSSVMQRCIIWRDIELKTSNITCPHTEIVMY